MQTLQNESKTLLGKPGTKVRSAWKKRAMSTAKWTNCIETDNMKHLETGYADAYPKYSYWVQPMYYSGVEWYAMADWMTKTFGDSDWSTPNSCWIGSDRKYWFRNEADRNWFMLRWL